MFLNNSDYKENKTRYNCRLKQREKITLFIWLKQREKIIKLRQRKIHEWKNRYNSHKHNKYENLLRYQRIIGRLD